MEIEHLGIKDWQRFKQIRLAALKDTPQAFGNTYENAKHYSDDDWRSQIETSATFIAVDDGSDLGMVRGIAGDTKTNTALLISMWVAPNGRGAGSGERLIEAVISWARLSGFTQLVLDVADNNTQAIALYNRCNFLPTGETGCLSPPRSHIKEHRRALIL